jgi:type I restriction enzyme, S subunit
MKSNYKQLGEFIQQVNKRNAGLKVKKLLGVSMNKMFIDSVANINGVDFEKYKIIRKDQFACKLMSVGRDKQLPVDLLKKYDEAIVSTAYYVFEVINRNVLLPEYLMMWFNRSDSDRYVGFISGGDVRGGISWSDFCTMPIIVPNIEIQKEIVKDYNIISNRIEINNQLIQKCEETAQAIYKRWFVEYEFPDKKGKPYQSNGGEMEYNEELDLEIPKGWEVQTIKKYCKDMKSGGTPNRSVKEYWDTKDIPWLKTGETKNNIIINSEEYISNKGLKESSAKLLPIDTVLMSMYGVNAGEIGILKFESSTNQASCGMICKNPKQSAHLYYHLLVNQSNIANQSIGGAQENLSKDFIEKINILTPSNELLEINIFKTIVDSREWLTRELLALKNLSEVLLSKMSQIKSIEVAQ